MKKAGLGIWKEQYNQATTQEVKKAAKKLIKKNMTSSTDQQGQTKSKYIFLKTHKKENDTRPRYLQEVTREQVRVVGPCHIYGKNQEDNSD